MMTTASLSQAGTRTVEDRLGWETFLDGGPAAPARARAATEALLGPAYPGRDLDDLILVVSELVTNAVRHAPGPCRLRLRPLDGAVEVTVSDTSPEPPRPRQPDLTAGRGGFGWPLLRDLTTSLRVTVRSGNKSVQAVVTVPPRGPSSDPHPPEPARPAGRTASRPTGLAHYHR